MEIYVVQPDDTIYSIAKKFGVSTSKLIQDNGLTFPNNLVTGQTIVIAYPTETYTVKDGDTLYSIAESFNISPMQLLRNNPNISDRGNLISGETIVISYHTNGTITTNGIAYPYILKKTLIKVLPSLTYISILNYRATEKGEIQSYYDDSEMVRISKDYGTIPLMLVPTFSPQGEPNIQIAYSILSTDEYQDRYIEDVLTIMKDKGYYGINMVFSFLNITTQSLYDNFVIKASKRFKEKGYLFFVTINPVMESVDNIVSYEKIDYTTIGNLVDNITFLKFVWGNNYGPPTPVSNISNIRALVNYVLTMVSPDKISIGKPIISYDWQLPYIPGKSSANSLTIESTLMLAMNTGSVIEFDEVSQTPFFLYNQINIGPPFQHIVWSIDARSINALEDEVNNYKLHGIAVWNIMVYHPQFWLLFNSQYDIIKYISINALNK